MRRKRLVNEFRTRKPTPVEIKKAQALAKRVDRKLLLLMEAKEVAA